MGHHGMTDDKIERAIPERIMEARRLIGKYQTEAAGKLGVHHTTLSKWETGTKPMSGPTLLKLSKLSGLSVEYLTGKEKGNGLYSLIDVEETPEKKECFSTPEPLLSVITQEVIEDPVPVSVQEKPGELEFAIDAINEYVAHVEENLSFIRFHLGKIKYQFDQLKEAKKKAENDREGAKALLKETLEALGN